MADQGLLGGQRPKLSETTPYPMLRDKLMTLLCGTPLPQLRELRLAV